MNWFTPWNWAFTPYLAIAGGFLSVAFTKMLLGMRKYFLHLPRKTWWWHPVVGGVTVGLMGWFVPQVLGVGYTYVGNALNGTMALKLLLLLVVLKLVGVTVSYASGNAGRNLRAGAVPWRHAGRRHRHGGSSPVAGVHGFAGSVCAGGMGALFAGIVRAPMTSVLMIFEMTRDYAVIVPFDDRKPDQLIYLKALSEAADL